MNIEGIEMEVRCTGDVCSDALEFLRRHNHENSRTFDKGETSGRKIGKSFSCSCTKSWYSRYDARHQGCHP